MNTYHILAGILKSRDNVTEHNTVEHYLKMLIYDGWDIVLRVC